jgi:small subunit ribosomal protein S16
MLMIRLQRVGKKKLASYRLIVSEKARDTHDKYTELLGTFNPHAKENAFQPKLDRVMYWIGKGAQPSPTIHNLLVAAGAIKDKKQKSVFLSKKRHAQVAEAKKAAAPKETVAPAA